jgi:hypothetical protein
MNIQSEDIALIVMIKFTTHVPFPTKERKLLLQKRKPSESNRSGSEGNSAMLQAYD